jgi:hypothetical protein
MLGPATKVSGQLPKAVEATLPALINHTDLTFSIFLTAYPCFDFKKYTGTSEFPFRALLQVTQ